MNQVAEIIRDDSAGPPQILLMEDESSVAQGLQMVLKEEGYKVDLAMTGQSALNTMSNKGFDLLVADLRLPDMNGMEVIKRVKDERPETKVIVITGYANVDSAVEAMKTGVADYLSKPFTEDEFKAAVQWVLRQKRAAPSTTPGEVEKEKFIQKRDVLHVLRRFSEDEDLLCETIDTTSRVVEAYKLSSAAKATLSSLASMDLEWIREGKGGLSQDHLETSPFIKALEQIKEKAESWKKEENVTARREKKGKGKGWEQASVEQTKLLQQHKMISLGRLAASVVHEINNPLSGILNYLGLMRKIINRESLSQEHIEKFSKYLTLVESEISRCSKIVSNLLAFSRRSKLEFSDVNVHELLEKSILLSQHKLDLQDIRVRTELEEVPTLWGDFNQLQQCVINLIFNAIDAMPDGGTLNMGCSFKKDENRVEISVGDTGCGIAREDLSHIFEPFYTTKKEGNGLGLGLATVCGIIERHKGEISVDSEPGKGTIFTMSLPVGQRMGRI